MTTTQARKRRKGGDGVSDLFVADFPLDLKRRIAAAADAQETTFQDLAVATLAAVFKVRYAAQKRRSPGISDTTTVALSVPEALHKKVKLEAVRRDVPMRTLVIGLLLDAFPAAR